MVREAVTGYWTLVSGLTEVTVERARAVARTMLAQGEATREQLTGLTQEITEASRANREALLRLVRFETERAAGRLGFASTEEVTTLQGRVRELERSIAELRATVDAQPARPARTAPAKKAAKAAPKAGPAQATKATKATTKAATKATKAPRKRASGGAS